MGLNKTAKGGAARRRCSCRFLTPIHRFLASSTGIAQESVRFSLHHKWSTAIIKLIVLGGAAPKGHGGWTTPAGEKTWQFTRLKLSVVSSQTSGRLLSTPRLETKSS